MRYDRLAPQIGSENARTAALGGEVLIAEKLPVWQLHICDWLALPVNLAAMEWTLGKSARGLQHATHGMPAGPIASVTHPSVHWPTSPAPGDAFARRDKGTTPIAPEPGLL